MFHICVQRLRRYFGRYNPARLPAVDRIAAQFAHREPVLSVLLRQKYGGNLMARDRHADLSELGIVRVYMISLHRVWGGYD